MRKGEEEREKKKCIPNRHIRSTLSHFDIRYPKINIYNFDKYIVYNLKIIHDISFFLY